MLTIRNVYNSIYAMSICYFVYGLIYKGDAVMDNREYLIELRNQTGMSRKEFCAYFEIPYRTLQDWELGNRKMPDYLLRLMAYKIEMEKIVAGNDKNGEEKNDNGD